MNPTKEYFIHLLSSFLNGEKPDSPKDIDWKELYKLANIHSLTAIVTNQIMLLSDEDKPDINTLKVFKQQLGYVLISYNEKVNLISDIRNVFNNNQIPFIFVKGTHLRNLYPVKELRTSGDIDVYVNDCDFPKCRQLLIDLDYMLEIDNANICEYKIGKESIELHAVSDYDHKYFSNIFEHSEKVSDYEYELNLEEHLLFVLMHIAKHMSSYGAGVRMFMDVDVIIRHIDHFDYHSFIKKCAENNLAVFAKTVFSLCSFWFNTPVPYEHDFSIDNSFNTNFVSSVIDGGSFGYEQRHTGDYYINKAISDGSKVNLLTKIKAILKMFFPSPDRLKNEFSYCKKCPVLLPAAWLHKILIGIFVRGRHSVKTIEQITKADSSAQDYADIIKELEL